MSDNVNLNHVEAEFQDIVNSSGWALMYQKLGQDCRAYQYTSIESKKLENKPLNRYRDVHPYDHSRIVLKGSDNDYINANLVKSERAKSQYILTQGPLGLTVGHFWLMVWEQRSHAILMLNKLVEKNEMKCCCYWPQGVGEKNRLELADVGLAVELLLEEDAGYYCTRELRLIEVSSGQSRAVAQFHYTTWPDFGVPSSPRAFLRFLKHVRASGSLDVDGPPIVHCSAGIGRSGTFCLVDACLRVAKRDGIAAVDVRAILLEMRRHRMGLIQTPDQLRFSFEAIVEGIRHLDSDDSEDEDSEDTVPSVDELAPPVPPRAASLTRPPARPLPPPPTGDSARSSDVESTSSDELPLSPNQLAPSLSPVAGDKPGPATTSVGEGLRQRRRRAMEERIASVRQKAKEAERWHALKRSLYKPLTITFGFVLAGILVYAYGKH